MAPAFVLSVVLTLVVAAIRLPCLADAQADAARVHLGSTLYANADNSTWTSPSGDFALGFRHFPGQEDQFLLAIWLARIPDRTIVWSAPAQPVPRGSKVELRSNGLLVLQAPGSSELWSTSNRNNSEPRQGAMLDTGNFVIIANDSSYIWESFKNPTNTILPGQILNVGDKLSSTLLEKNFAKGKFELVLNPTGLVLRQTDAVTGYPYGSYLTLQNATQLIFNESGDIFTKQSDNTLIQRTKVSFPTRASFYFRATLDFDGTFTQYIHPRSPIGNESWSVVSITPSNICFDILILMGSGPCGYNSYCEAGPQGKPKCGCPPGFSILDPNNPYSGCKQDSPGYQDCNLEASIIEDRFDLYYMDGVDWPKADYEQMTPSSENECKSYCLRDCNCAVAIFQDPKFNNGSGSCWKKKLPLSNGRLDRGAIDRRAFFKISKENTSLQLPQDPDSREKDQDQVILILSILLGTSALFNFFSIAGTCLVINFLYQRKLYNLCTTSDDRDFGTNLRSYKYGDLEKATNNFKEELGRGAFGTVYKGLLQSSSRNYVAVKRLDKMVQEGQKEFLNEVNTIGQTHHKNLVRLLGYCDEGDRRLLVYEFMQNGSLSDILFGSPRLNWHQRVQIASGIARGLMYLHEECSKQIIHCDIKPQNILLDDTFTAKISDFGLAKLLINNQTQTLTGIRGTKGYVALEWFRNTPVTVKVDVYSFGVMLLEIICCRRCVDFEMEKEAILADWAYECYIQRKVEKLVENDEEAINDLKRVQRMVMVAIWCVQDEPMLRPTMRTVALMLEGILEVSVPPCPFTYSALS